MYKLLLNLAPVLWQTMPHYIDIVTLSNFYKPLQEQEVYFIFLINWKITATNTFGLLHGTYEEMPYQDLVCLNDVKALHKEERLWKTWLHSNGENCWKCIEFVNCWYNRLSCRHLNSRFNEITRRELKEDQIYGMEVHFCPRIMHWCAKGLQSASF